MKHTTITISIGLLMLVAVVAFAQDQINNASANAFEEAQKQRELFIQTAGILPGELFAFEGEEYFYTPRGPNEVTMEDCDFGLGPGVLEGAYAQMPRYFEDSDMVEDADRRVVSCMVNHQGYAREDIDRDAVKALVSFIASLSMDEEIAVSLEHPKMQEMNEIGELLWFYRAGSRDFSCESCHDGYSGKRVRLAPLRSPDEGLSDHWPAYRFQADALYTLEDRIQFCFNSISVPAPDHYSDAIVALEVYMRNIANGFPLDVVGFTR